MKTGEPQRPWAESQRPMNSQSDSRSRFCPKYSFGSVASSFFFSSFAVVLALVVDDAAEAGPDRIDEHEIGEGEPRRLVLHEPRRHLRERPVRRERDALRADRPEMEERRRRTRPAVEDEHHRTVVIAGVGDVRDGEDLGGRLLLLP